MTVPPTHHATALVLDGKGVLIRGASGAGKTSLALFLIRRFQECNRFGLLVADDRVILDAYAGGLIARAPLPLAGLVEIFGLGVRKTDFEPAAVIHLVADLVEEKSIHRMPEEKDVTAVIEGVALPRLALPERSLERALLLVEAVLISRHSRSREG